MRTGIVYEDGDVIVCYKPAGLAVQTAKVGQMDMACELKNYLFRQKGEGKRPEGVDPYLGIVHRLDQPAEGFIVFGKTRKAAAALSGQLAKGDFNKQYYAAVCGLPKEREGCLVDYLYKDKDNYAKAADKEERRTDAKRAALQYYIVKSVGLQGLSRKEDGEARFSETMISLADISIETGRFHQIRAQMAHAGHPLLGDRKYGDERSLAVSESLGIRNTALWAYKLEFVHPVTGRRMCFEDQDREKKFLHGIFAGAEGF